MFVVLEIVGFEEINVEETREEVGEVVTEGAFVVWETGDRVEGFSVVATCVVAKFVICKYVVADCVVDNSVVGKLVVR